MGFLGTLFGGRNKAQVTSAVAQRQASRDAHRETLSAAVRRTLGVYGIPHLWLGAETLPASTPAEPAGLHLRLVIRHAHPDFLASLYALERAIHAQLLQLDPQCARWALGTSWRMEVPPETAFGQLPGPSFWQSKAPTLSAGVAAGPSAKHQLVQSMMARDSAFAETTVDAPDFGPTHPIMAR